MGNLLFRGECRWDIGAVLDNVGIHDTEIWIPFTCTGRYFSIAVIIPMPPYIPFAHFLTMP